MRKSKSNIMETNQPNDTARELENIRKERLKKAYENQKKMSGRSNDNDDGSGDSTVNKDETNKDTKKSTESQEKNEKKLDNDEKNSYINIEYDKLDDETKKTLEQTFGGDPIKAIKAYNDSNREFMRFRNQVQEDQAYLDKITNIVENNPVVGEILDKADQEEDIESFLKNQYSESKDKPNQSNESKPNITDNINEVSEKDLIESGYLNREEKDYLTADQWDEKRRQASIRYMYNELPNKLAESAASKYEKQIERMEEQKRAQRQKEQNERLIRERYLNGIEKISRNYNFDFENSEEHKELLKKIERRASTIPDYDNPHVIDEDAIEIATDYVLKKEGLMDDMKVEEPETPKEENLYDRNQFNVSGRKDNTKKPKTIADKLREKHKERYESGLQRQVVSKSKN